MTDLETRLRMAAESILENEALRGGLGEGEKLLLDWGIACAESLTLETAQIEDDEEADDAIYPRMKALRKMLAAAKELAVSSFQTQPELDEALQKVFLQASILYGPAWQAPVRNEGFLTAGTAQRLELLRSMVEQPPEKAPEKDISFGIETDLANDEGSPNLSISQQKEDLNKGERNVTFDKKTPI